MNKYNKNIKKRNSLWSKKERTGLKIAGYTFLVAILFAVYYLINQDIERKNQLIAMAGKELAHNKVCMVGDVLKFKELDKIVIDGKHYWVCCPKCKAQLLYAYKKRFAVDPVTQKEVDKAEAFITQSPTMKERVLYFETSKNFEIYKTKM